jgi:hypothetical protein
MPVGGKLILKGGLQVTSTGVEKKKKKRKKPVIADNEDPSPDATKAVASPSSTAPAQGQNAGAQPTTDMSKPYEQEFASEMDKARQGRAKSTPWGTGYRVPPKILHGYSGTVRGRTAEERLDMRSATKSDKFCK